MILTLPFEPTIVTLPFSTVASFVLDEVQVTSLEASFGLVTAVRSTLDVTPGSMPMIVFVTSSLFLKMETLLTAGTIVTVVSP